MALIPREPASAEELARRKAAPKPVKKPAPKKVEPKEEG